MSAPIALRDALASRSTADSHHAARAAAVLDASRQAWDISAGADRFMPGAVGTAAAAGSADRVANWYLQRAMERYLADPLVGSALRSVLDLCARRHQPVRSIGSPGRPLPAPDADAHRTADDTGGTRSLSQGDPRADARRAWPRATLTMLSVELALFGAGLGGSDAVTDPLDEAEGVGQGAALVLVQRLLHRVGECTDSLTAGPRVERLLPRLRQGENLPAGVARVRPRGQEARLGQFPDGRGGCLVSHAARAARSAVVIGPRVSRRPSTAAGTDASRSTVRVLRTRVPTTSRSWAANWWGGGWWLRGRILHVCQLSSGVQGALYYRVPCSAGCTVYIVQ